MMTIFLIVYLMIGVVLSSYGVTKGIPELIASGEVPKQAEKLIYKILVSILLTFAWGVIFIGLSVDRFYRGKKK